jgi:hypothetical protein
MLGARGDQPLRPGVDRLKRHRRGLRRAGDEPLLAQAAAGAHEKLVVDLGTEERREPPRLRLARGEVGEREPQLGLLTGALLLQLAPDPMLCSSWS